MVNTKQQTHLIFTDGSSLGNGSSLGKPGPGGWAAVILLQNSGDQGRIFELGGGEKKTTNNRMELTALIEGLARIKEEKGDVSIYLDSSYVHKGATQWSHAWKKNDWKTKGKKDVENRDLWETLLSLLDERKELGHLTWEHIPGHSGIAGNERADVIATGFARLCASPRLPEHRSQSGGQAKDDDVELFEGELGDYTVDILNTAVNEKVAEKRSASRAHSRAKAYSYLSLVNGEVMRHSTWADCERRVKGKASVKYKKALSPEDESVILKNWGVSP